MLPTLPLAIKLLLFLGCHKKDILTLRWDQVKLDEGIILWDNSKTGSRLIALPQSAIAALKTAPRREGNPFACWGKKSGSHLVGVNKYFGQVVEKSGLGATLRIQDLRQIAMTRSQWLALI